MGPSTLLFWTHYAQRTRFTSAAITVLSFKGQAGWVSHSLHVGQDTHFGPSGPKWALPPTRCKHWYVPSVLYSKVMDASLTDKARILKINFHPFGNHNVSRDARWTTHMTNAHHPSSLFFVFSPKLARPRVPLSSLSRTTEQIVTFGLCLFTVHQCSSVLRRSAKYQQWLLTRRSKSNGPYFVHYLVPHCIPDASPPRTPHI